MLAKALAHHFEAKLLLLDTTDFSLKIQSKYGASAKPNEAYADKAVLLILDQPPLRSTSGWSFDEKLFVQTLYKVLTNTANNSPIVLYLRDVEKFLGRSQRINTLFQKMLKKISGPILILGSRVADFDKDYNLVDERVTTVFPYTIDIKPPEEENHLELYVWDDAIVFSKYIEEEIVCRKLQAPMNAVSVAATTSKCCRIHYSKYQEVPPDNEFEKRIRPEVIPASEIGVSFADIGALNEIKESLQELLKYHHLFIFVDDVDSMLGSRGKGGEHEAMRKIKNEFMTHWDGLVSSERILVLAATNRPFDLD
ncbi:calmodulin-interacting protein 111-like protein isoform X1 [Tanacetum coccineum]